MLSKKEKRKKYWKETWHKKGIGAPQMEKMEIIWKLKKQSDWSLKEWILKHTLALSP